MDKTWSDKIFFGGLMRFFFLIFAVSLLSSCSPLTRYEERMGDIETRYTSVESDLENWVNKKSNRTNGSDGLSLPSVDNALKLPDNSHLLSAPKRPVLDNDKLVTLSVTDNIPIKEVLIELSRRADIDMEIDPTITGGIILSVKDKPFSEVIKRVAKLAKLVYSFDDGVLKVEADRPKIVNYRFNILDMSRSSSGSMNSANTLASGGEGGGITNGSSNTLSTNTGQGDLWAVLAEGVNNILTATTRPSDIVASGGEGASGPSILSLNRSAGVVSIYANSEQHKQIKSYFDYIHISHTSQVLIEAKVIEVTLNDDFRSGIDWSYITEDKFVGNISSVFPMPEGENTTDFVSFALGPELGNLDAAVQMVEAFGTTRTLSSPRLHAMNNQFAMLSFAENTVYFTITIDEETEDSSSSSTSSISVESEIHTVPVGVVLNLMPSIDLESNEVVMSIRPTLTRITGTVEDPGFAYKARAEGITDLSSDIPIIASRELDTVLRIKSGQVMVIGGLLNERTEKNDRGVPFLAHVPVIGNAFKAQERATTVVETVVFIKATIVPGSGVSIEDTDFYNKFAKDQHTKKGI